MGIGYRPLLDLTEAIVAELESAHPGREWYCGDAVLEVCERLRARGISGAQYIDNFHCFVVVNDEWIVDAWQEQGLAAKVWAVGGVPGDEDPAAYGAYGDDQYGDDE